MKTGIWTNSVFKKLLQCAQMVNHGKEYEEEIQRKKKPWQKTEAPTMVVSLRISAQKNPDEKGWACYYCGQERHLKQDCPQASKLPLAPCPVCKMTTPEERLPSEA